MENAVRSCGSRGRKRRRSPRQAARGAEEVWPRRENGPRQTRRATGEGPAGEGGLRVVEGREGKRRRAGEM